MAQPRLAVSPGPERPAHQVLEQLRAYRLSLPDVDETFVLVIKENGDPVGWTRQAQPFDCAPALGRLYETLSRLTHGPVAVSDIECLTKSSSSNSTRWDVAGDRRQIPALEGGRQ